MGRWAQQERRGTTGRRVGPSAPPAAVLEVKQTDAFSTEWLFDRPVTVTVAGNPDTSLEVETPIPGVYQSATEVFQIDPIILGAGYAGPITLPALWRLLAQPTNVTSPGGFTVPEAGSMV